MIPNHFQFNAKAYASGLAAFLGSVAIDLTQQPVSQQGIEHITQLGWVNIALFVLASYGITWGVSNKTPVVPVVDTTPPKQGAHAA